uniref:Uncharacterized protein n=1 Tax=Siphoviridae sp. ct1TR2 TaxID=2825309 RepID=A0A8S5NSK6_9CAUD|nr:MAG TPA: hypothetical protein [Siphoviridae sp. ct1TR2]
MTRHCRFRPEKKYLSIQDERILKSMQCSCHIDQRLEFHRK